MNEIVDRTIAPVGNARTRVILIDYSFMPRRAPGVHRVHTAGGMSRLTQPVEAEPACRVVHGPKPSRIEPRAVHSVCVDPSALGARRPRVAARRRIRWTSRGSWHL